MLGLPGPSITYCDTVSFLTPLLVGLSHFFFLINLFYLFIFGCVGVFVAACRLSLVAASGGYSSLWCVGFSLWWLLLLQSMGSRAQASVVVAHGLSSCGARAQLLRGIWDLPGPGLKPVSPALAGGFLTTAPPGKPPK